MNDASIFRREAIEHHANRASRGNIIRLRTRWTTLGFWAFISLLVVAAGALASIKVDRALSAVDVAVSGGNAAVTFKEDISEYLAEGSEVTIETDGRSLTAYTTSVSSLERSTGTLVLLDTSDVDENSKVVVQIRQPLLDALFPGLKRWIW